MSTLTKTSGAAVLGLVLGLGSPEATRAAEDSAALDARQKSIIPIAAFTADGDMGRLDAALVAGLEAGLTVNEVKEILVQMYAYAGFPRSLNGIFAFMGVLEARRAQGIEDELGPEASPVPDDLDRDAYGAEVRAKLAGVDEIPPPSAWQQFVPMIDVYLKEHLFGDIFARDVLDHQERELATIAALAAMDGTAGPLRFHPDAAMNTGLGEGRMQDFIDVLRAEVGEAEADAAAALLAEVLGKRGG